MIGPVSVHVFVDESRRGATYFLAASHMQPDKLGRTRTALRSLCLGGQRRIHFKDEGCARRREIIARLECLGLRVAMYTSQEPGELARENCLRGLVADLVEANARRLVLESRASGDRLDLRVLRTAMGHHARRTGLVYEHLRPHEEPLLWVPDAVAWCFGSGGDWRRRVAKLVVRCVDTDLL
ncbi:hypothetical protein GCM10010174_30690 [Kutzneria viridogrisea]